MILKDLRYLSFADSDMQGASQNKIWILRGRRNLTKKLCDYQKFYIRKTP